jgi:hypothetical protein
VTEDELTLQKAKAGWTRPATKTSWYEDSFVKFIVFILISTVIYQSEYQKTTQLTGKEAPKDFSVVVEVGTAAAPKKNLIKLNDLDYERKHNEFLTLNLAPGKRPLAENSSVTYEVTALSDGVRVDVLLDYEYSLVRCVYSIKDDKVVPELYEVTNGMALWEVVIGGPITTLLLYRVLSVLRRTFNLYRSYQNAKDGKS